MSGIESLGREGIVVGKEISSGEYGLKSIKLAFNDCLNEVSKVVFESRKNRAELAKSMIKLFLSKLEERQ
jgi:hypothetical protein